MLATSKIPDRPNNKLILLILTQHEGMSSTLELRKHHGQLVPAPKAPSHILHSLIYLISDLFQQ